QDSRIQSLQITDTTSDPIVMVQLSGDLFREFADPFRQLGGYLPPRFRFIRCQRADEFRGGRNVGKSTIASRRFDVARAPQGRRVPRLLLNLIKRIETRRWLRPVLLQPEQN